MKPQKDEPFLSQEERDALYAMMYHARAQQGSAIPPTPAMYKAASNVKLEWLPQQLELTL